MGGVSGIGTFGIQITKLYGCDVIATSSDNKLKQYLKLGADFAVDHRKGRLAQASLCNNKKPCKRKGNKCFVVDVIFEHIRGSHWNKELTLLKYGATVVTTGATIGYEVQTDLRHAFFKGINVLGSTQGTRSELVGGCILCSKER